METLKAGGTLAGANPILQLIGTYTTPFGLSYAKEHINIEFFKSDNGDMSADVGGKRILLGSVFDTAATTLIAEAIVGLIGSELIFVGIAAAGAASVIYSLVGKDISAA